jgi:hypothetical protein
MREFISQPGIQFYVYQLQGSLSYNVTLPKKPTRQFELREDDFDSFSSERECEIGHHVPGTDASAIGLKLKLVRNDGLLQVRYEGRDGGTAKWTFNGLQETSRQSAMYASAGSQTSIMTFDLKPTQKNPESLLDAKTDAFLRERKIDIESVLGKEKDGTIWQISHGGAAKRIFGPSRVQIHCISLTRLADEDVEVTEPIAVEPPTVARRVSNRNRVEKTLPYAAFESLPRCIYLPGQTKIQGGDYVNGALMLDQAHFSVAFETTREIMQTEIDSDVSSKSCLLISAHNDPNQPR